ncbi:hypothetical protein AB0M36_36435 [Actinoplanes sp. NPDC051346]|uniref:hypothetical protein n=1 Tax=Actinoplanes sp. NPDC051346 TaxID=3155048 RepID=UPI0034400D16
MIALRLGVGPDRALRVAEHVGTGGQFATVKLYSPGILIGNAKGRKDTAGFCQDAACGHAPFTAPTKRSNSTSDPLQT